MAILQGNRSHEFAMLRRWTAAVAALFVTQAASADGFLARTFSVKETGWVANLDIHLPKDRWNQYNRDITLVSAEVLRSWEFGHGLEALAGGGIFIANGTRTAEGTADRIRSDAYGVSFGGGVRWYPFELYGARPFGEGLVHIAYTPGHPFPAGGSAVNGYLRAGGGLRYDVSDRYAIEAGFHLAHVSNGGGLVPGNPAYNGQGWFLNGRWRS